jgi:hypothetical protein
VTVTPGKDLRNPHMFYVTLSGQQVLGSAKVKVELWQAQPAALQGLALRVSTVSSSAGRAFVPTLTLDEIFVDKVYALGARARIKPRDVFDLWWLHDKALPPPTAQALQARLAIYPAPSGQPFDTAQLWLASAGLRLQDLQAQNAAALLAADLKRWLPSSWLMNGQVASTMLAVAIAQLQNAMQLMQGVQSQLKATAATASAQP